MSKNTQLTINTPEVLGNNTFSTYNRTRSQWDGCHLQALKFLFDLVVVCCDQIFDIPVGRCGPLGDSSRAIFGPRAGVCARLSYQVY